MARTTTRRELLRVRRLSGDAAELSRLLELEHLAVEVYGLAWRSGRLSPRAVRLAREIQSQEEVHAAHLAAALDPGARPRPVRGRVSDHAVQLALEGHRIHVELARLHSERAWFTLLERLESALEGAYYEALGRIVSPATGTLAARILASEAQHQTLLFRLRHPHDVSLAVATPVVYGDAPPPQ